MNKYVISRSADHKIDDIYLYTVETWGTEQADRYVRGLFDLFQQIADKQVLWRTIPAEFRVQGFYTKYQKHFVFWKELPNGDVGIASILHERMDIGRHLSRDF